MTWRTELERTAAALRRASGAAEHAEGLLAQAESRLAATDTAARRRALAEQLRTAAATAATGWLGEELASIPSGTPVWPDEPREGAVRIGTAELEDEPAFPALVDLLGGGHLVCDGDAADPRVAGMLQSLLVRLVAAHPGLEVSLVDGVTLGQVFAPATALVDAGMAEPVATDHLGLAKVLTDAEKRLTEIRDIAARGQSIANRPYHLIVIAGLPPQVGKTVRERIAALAHAGPAARCHLVICGWRTAIRTEPLPAIEHATHLSCREAAMPSGAPSPARLGTLPLPIVLDPVPPPSQTRTVFDARAAQRREAETLTVGDLVPDPLWADSSRNGLSTVIGRDAGGDVTVSFDDATPHWLIGGRTGGGKTVFLLDVLYGLATRYSPEELELYLLDFKEGVSFTEFTPSAIDESWIPHVRAVGVESDREYGVAVLSSLRGELSRRAGMMKRAGATRLARLRELRPEVPLPRIVAVVDEFHVLFSGNDRLARQAVAHLEELARKGRSYGVHLVLASQTISGIEALYSKKDSIFGQFPLRVALPGAKHLLDDDNDAAAGLSVGQAHVNDSGGIKGRGRTCAFPDASSAEDLLAELRHTLWERRESDVEPVVFRGFDEQHLTGDPTFAALQPNPLPKALLGRAVDVGVTTVGYSFDRSPGRHLAVLGTSAVAADILAAAAISLGRQHEPGSVEFHLAATAAGVEDVAEATVESLKAQGHKVRLLEPGSILTTERETPTYLVWFGADGADGKASALKRLLLQGPADGIHLIGWWRGARRFLDDIGGSSNREHCAGVVALNIAANDLGAVTGNPNHGWESRSNRCLVIDRHAGAETLAVPYVRPGRLDEYQEAGR
ncbi:FtsK/SpoIIIE domain-containing protein [Glycomyces buryatensis]|uniref:Cell division protein FtsK n=1 Tax=Glycomyces buryatensis TaxID=2570927 RepID=A0A4S8QIK9_9ACTN|nr:FtsK/SpoIIIE domain-containing protein [Glycomyces buryatensis]THV42835.1 cell division protein FtsK [Glycomyces buryatensis]